jgi:protease II
LSLRWSQERLYQEMRGRIKEEDAGVPERLHGWVAGSDSHVPEQYLLVKSTRLRDTGPRTQLPQLLTSEDNMAGDDMTGTLDRSQVVLLHTHN